MTRGGEQADPAASGARVPTSRAERGAVGNPGGQAGGCIILADSEASVPAELLAGLSRRGMKVAVVTDTPAAMVRLVREGAAAILLAAGVELPGQADLLDAVREYAPATGCWSFARAGNGIRLHKLEIRAAAHPDAPVAATNGRGAVNGHGAPKRRPLDDIVLHLPGAGLAPGEPLVSEEELAMLLGSGADGARP